MVPRLPQLKFNVDEELMKKFKQIVLAKHGKIELTSEGAEAIRLYINSNEHLIKSGSDEDPIGKLVGSVSTRKRRNALADVKRLDSGTL